MTYSARLVFGVGYTKSGSVVSDLDTKLRVILEEASRRFGGATLIESLGGWLDAGKLIREGGRVLIIDGLHDNDGSSCDVDNAKKFAVWVRDLLNQASVVLTIQQATTWFV